MKWILGFIIFSVVLIFKLVYGLFAFSRFDIDNSVDRLMFVNGYGHLLGFPTRPGTSSTATTGVPTNGLLGWAPGALFINFKSAGAGTCLYVNQGSNGYTNGAVTNATSSWFNIA